MRAPFAKVSGSTPAHYVVNDVFPANGQMSIQVDGQDPDRLRLQPVFPGKLSFKPNLVQILPADPSALSAPAITGSLYLELSPAAMRELRQRVPSLGLPLVFAYLGVSVGPEFFNGTVLKALTDPKTSQYRRVTVPGISTPLTTKAELAHGFASGIVTIDLLPTANDPVYLLPKITVSTGSQYGSVNFALGVRNRIGPASTPVFLKDAIEATLIKPQAFALIPVHYFYRLLRHTSGWKKEIAADNHDEHPLYASFDALENASPLGRWRRLRIFVKGPSWSSPHPPTPKPTAAYDTIKAEAKNSAGASLWTSNVSRLGEVYQQRVDNENFALSVNALLGGSYPLTTGPAAPASASPNLLSLKWNAPAATQEPPGIDVTAGLPAPDPLAAAVTLSFGAYDGIGSTYDRAGTQIAQQELVIPYKALLASFGFGATVDLFDQPKFDYAMQHAVREFQRASKTADRTVGGVAQPVSVTFSGTNAKINGKIDADTRTEMGVWRSHGYRTNTTFHVERGSGTSLTTFPDVGYPSEASIGLKVRVDPSTPLGILQKDSNSPGVGISNLTTVMDLVSWLTNPNTTLPADWTNSQVPPTWVKRVICAVARNESGGAFEAINQWDSAFLSCGLFQWTSGQGTESGELPGICSTLSSPDFTSLFKTYGLNFDNVTGTFGSKLLRGKWTLDTLTMDADMKQELRGFVWAKRFREAATTEAFRQCQWKHCVSRLRILLHEQLTWPGTQQHLAVEQLLQSELMCAVALDQYVNVPAHAVPALQDCLNAMLDPNLLIAWRERNHPLRRARVAKALYNLTYNELSQAQKEAVESDAQTAMTAELAVLETTCNSAQTSSLKTGTTVLTFHQMTQAQHDALRDLYKWQRDNLRTMTDPQKRWKSIVVTGGYAGQTIEDCQTTPGVWTP